MLPSKHWFHVFKFLLISDNFWCLVLTTFWYSMFVNLSKRIYVFVGTEILIIFQSICICSCNQFSQPGKIYTDAVNDLIFQVLKSLHDRFHHIVSQENFPRVAQLVGIKTALITILESLCGVAEGTRIDNLQRLFSFFLPILQDCVRLLGVFPYEHFSTDTYSTSPINYHYSPASYHYNVTSDMVYCWDKANFLKD